MFPTSRRLVRRSFIIVALLCASCLPAVFWGEPCHPRQNAGSVREPAVAGIFYPKDPAELSRAIDNYLDGAKTVAFDGELKALICPMPVIHFPGPVGG